VRFDHRLLLKACQLHSTDLSLRARLDRRLAGHDGVARAGVLVDRDAAAARREAERSEAAIPKQAPDLSTRPGLLDQATREIHEREGTVRP
jgi:hypothetical protein